MKEYPKIIINAPKIRPVLEESLSSTEVRSPGSAVQPGHIVVKGRCYSGFEISASPGRERMRVLLRDGSDQKGNLGFSVVQREK